MNRRTRPDPLTAAIAASHAAEAMAFLTKHEREVAAKEREQNQPAGSLYSACYLSALEIAAGAVKRSKKAGGGVVYLTDNDAVQAMLKRAVTSAVRSIEEPVTRASGSLHSYAVPLDSAAAAIHPALADPRDPETLIEQAQTRREKQIAARAKLYAHVQKTGSKRLLHKVEWLDLEDLRDQYDRREIDETGKKRLARLERELKTGTGAGRCALTNSGYRGAGVSSTRTAERRRAAKRAASAAAQQELRGLGFGWNDYCEDHPAARTDPEPKRKPASKPKRWRELPDTQQLALGGAV